MIEWLRQAVVRVNRADLAVQRRVARLPRSPADSAIIHLTSSANQGLLWLGLAAALATRPGATRRGALRGIAAITGASVSANVILKPLVPRRRPPAQELPAYRTLLDRPRSSSFPSGHAASAAAFATAVAMESHQGALVVAPVAAAVAYSRVHVGVHWTSDVVAGVAVGAGAALLTRRWWPVRHIHAAQARPLNRAPELIDGAGLVIAVNPRSGDSSSDLTEQVKSAFPAAELLLIDEHTELERELEHRLADGSLRALGVAGGDGTVAAVATVASTHKLPLVLIPAGTLNHFARDVGVAGLTDAAAAAGAGEAVEVDLGAVRLTDRNSGKQTTYHFLNTASLGCYSELVRRRERWERHWGKWPAFVAALVVTLHRASPLRVRVDGAWCSVWVLFVGNGPYHPSGMVPAWRPRLDSRLLDIRWLRADVRFSRTRASFALWLAALTHSRVYHQHEAPTVEVELPESAPLAIDGELLEAADQFHFSVIDDPIGVYRRDGTDPAWYVR